MTNLGSLKVSATTTEMGLRRLTIVKPGDVPMNYIGTPEEVDDFICRLADVNATEDERLELEQENVA